MSVTIWHNPKCGTSRALLAIIRDAGITPQIVEYLTTPPDAATLARVAAAVGCAGALLRVTATTAAEKGLPSAADAVILAAMAADPLLINRPVVITPKSHGYGAAWPSGAGTAVIVRAETPASGPNNQGGNRRAPRRSCTRERGSASARGPDQAVSCSLAA